MLCRCLVNMDVLLLKMLIMVSGFLPSELCCEGEFITNPCPLVGNWTVDQKRWGICTWKMCQFDLFLEIVKWDGHSIRPAIWLVVTRAKRIVKWGELTLGYKLLMGRTVLNVYVFPAVIGHAIPWSWHASGWSTGKGTHRGPTCPCTTVLAPVMLLPAKEPDSSYEKLKWVKHPRSLLLPSLV